MKSKKKVDDILVEPQDIDFEDIPAEIEDFNSSPSKYEIATYPADFTLEVLYNKWKAYDIEIPRFQRQFVWKIYQASKLIESFLTDLPVPPIYFYKERKSQKLLVVDGQQRLKSVFYFFDGFFDAEKRGRREVFRLRGLNEKSEYANKTFQEFSEVDKRKLKDKVLRSFVVQQINPNDNTSIYHIFERLNTGGTLLTNQEVRNCVYHGKFNDLLIELNKYNSLRKILGKPYPDSRQRDVELILRFFALLDIGKYEKPLKEYLTKFMAVHKNPDKRFLSQAENLFKNVCDTVLKHLGEKPFHVRAGLNSAVYDCVMVAFAHNLKRIPSDIEKRYKKLVNNEAFFKVTSGATTDNEVVRKRFEMAQEFLFEK